MSWAKCGKQKRRPMPKRKFKQFRSSTGRGHRWSPSNPTRGHK